MLKYDIFGFILLPAGKKSFFIDGGWLIASVSSSYHYF